MMRIGSVVAMLENYIEYMDQVDGSLSDYERGQLNAYQFLLKQILSGGDKK
jgi:hypothetical protein